MSKFVHMELNTGDVKAAKEFYKAIFGWKYEDMKMPDGVYAMILTPEGGLGGIQKNPMPGAPNHWLGYVSVESIKRTTKKVEQRGGKTLVPEQDIGMGKLAVFQDRQGVTFAVWEAVPQPPADATAEAEKAVKDAAKKVKKAAKKAVKKAAKKVKKVAKKAAKKAAKKVEKAAKKVERAAKKPASAKKKSVKKKSVKKKSAKKKSAKKK